MIEKPENQIKPPKIPLTLAINGAITDYYFNWFMNKYLPAGRSALVTSTYRSPQKNKSIGGASNSSHMHNLGRDFIITRNGKEVTKQETADIFNTIIKPKWSGYALNEGDHIHVNLSRKIGVAAGLLAMSVIGIIGITFFQNFKGKK